MSDTREGAAMTDLSLRERLAAAMALRAGHEWLTMPDTVSAGEQWQYGRDWWRGMAATAIHELTCALPDNGLAIVPVKATHTMLFEGDNKGATRTIWAVMVKAAPPAADLLRGKTNDQG